MRTALRTSTSLISGALFACAALVAGVTGAAAAPPADIDAYVAKTMQTFGPPGLSLAIVENGQVVKAKGYGVRRMGTSLTADEHTAFPIGSESKAFTSAALAILVDQKKLKWTDLVKDKLPGFQMYDPYVTDHMTVRDLLTHRSGLSLGEGDLLMVPDTNRSRADFVHALRYLKPATGFREKFAYDNILYIVAGQLVQAVSGQTWEDFVRQNIFKPVGMSDALTNYDAKAPNEVSLHARLNGPFRGTGDQSILAKGLEPHASAPAGAINASALDMAKWMNVQLAHGKLPNGEHVFSEQQAAEMWNPVVVVPPTEFKLPGPMAIMQPDLQTYALGWFVEEYRGHRIVQHSGAVLGALAMQFLIPEKNVGISVTINSEDSVARRAVAYHLLDYYLGLPPTDWITLLKKTRESMVAETVAALKKLPKPNMAGGAKPPLALDAYTGTYSDPWYGTMTITDRGAGKLWIRFDRTPGMEGALEPVSGNKFRTVWTDKGIEDAYIDFTLKGKTIEGLSMSAISPLADFSFDYQDLHFVPAAAPANAGQ
jgi:CubicO group peptidase (beta-lactamase class C family)